ncbi:MAG: hypothetical protein IKR82_03260 [Bacteroidales bacterium]|nr:hypothetical protein [Bacteroidales bacterium]
MKRFRWILLLLLMVALVPVAQKLIAGVPAAEAFSLRNGLYILICALSLAVFCVAFTFSVIRGRILVAPVLHLTLLSALWVLIVFGVAWLLVRFAAGIVGMVAYIGAPVLILAVYLPFYYRGRRKAVRNASVSAVRRSAHTTAAVKYNYRLLFSALLVLLLGGVVALCTGEATHYLFFPVAAASLSFLLWRLLSWRGFLLLGFLAVELCALVYCVPLASGVASADFWRIAVLTLLYLSVLVPLGDLYCTKEPIA